MKKTLDVELAPDSYFVVPKWAFFIWIRLPKHIDCRELQRRCNVVGVDIAIGPDFFSEDFGGNYVRLNFTLYEDAIRLGVTLLASHTKEILGMSEATPDLVRGPPAHPRDGQGHNSRLGAAAGLVFPGMSDERVA